jgi:hypothetical protein
MDEIIAAIAGAIITVALTPLTNRLFKKYSGYISDREAVGAWMLAFQRPAFRGAYANLRFDYNDLLDAIGQTTHVLDTGDMRELGSTMPTKAITQLHRKRWRGTGQEAVNLLSDIQNELRALIDGRVEANESLMRVDQLRDHVVEQMNMIWREAGKGEQALPTKMRPYPL